ncbi:MAG TPA: dipeptide/oligopeptide/nickel ABC transporter permease/ATP-binding protein [Thermomonospora sp.]|nr:dipeptide/oligopeptide/nickel ABC transporter permease/ATP-binding protein [Thermomonospora sp.]
MSLAVTGDAAPVEAPPSPRFARRLLRRPLAVACLSYLALVVGVAVVAPLVLPDVAHQQAGDLLAANQGPSADHLLGTDTVGRDVLERLLVGTRVTVLGVLEAVVVMVLLGVSLGLAAGFHGGWIDRAVTWLADLAFSTPAIAIVIVVLSVFPGSMIAGMTTFGVLAAPGLMRVVRAATLSTRQELYVQAAQVAGLSQPYIIARHVLPRISGATVVQVSVLAAVALTVQTGLAFLHLLVETPAPSWGGMVADGTTVILVNPWLIWPPGMAIALTILALGLLGDAVRDAAVEGWSAAPSRKRRRTEATAPPATETSGTELPDDALLAVRGLTVSTGGTRLVEDVAFHVAEGEAVGIVGESGCGKSVTASALIGILARGLHIEAGEILFGGEDLTRASGRALRRVRGKEIALISQEPLISLDPAFTVGGQLGELVRQHHGLSKKEARRRVVELLDSVHLPDPEDVARRYPHELSGGMAQRVSIARALVGEPRLLIADEPTTALDVTVQAEILDLLRELKATRGMSILLITHDWGTVADLCDRAIVMYAGQVVEQSEVSPMFAAPLHPYTAGLLASDPHRATRGALLPAIEGQVPPPGSRPVSCRFRARCDLAAEECGATAIPLLAPAPGRLTRCIRHQELEHA